MTLIKYMTNAKDERWWIQGLGLMAGAVWAGARALGNGRPPLLRVGFGVAAICFLAAIAGLFIDRIRAARRGRRGSADDTAAGEQQEP
ncbi:hypothetical protein SAV14893_031060 [Streptomyces avermitilis]|uniref:Uncharacterized protein n=1 Tax=Streptomyces avermitilis TaxID=33903 RepID=A0A4D4LZ94_STRAX|nr:hypothetical protein SAVMC3_43040 [Streptomyces avermitilis]GDY63713.1 hypothetical protein SAV14893_031060 [Streptomyces avermitilis]GDY76145.1 hypothetical protein SAV31267_056300 [Streptomyces avermitilis]GDY85091.1 hypothetical protein SAVCW2_42900 [Streptomyces avermitilis]